MLPRLARSRGPGGGVLQLGLLARHLCERASIRMLLADLGQGQHELVVFLGLPRKASPEDKDVLEM